MGEGTLTFPNAEMRVLLGVPWYFPHSVGGSEVYVRGLAEGLDAAGVRVSIAVPTSEPHPSSSRVDGIDVFRYPAPYANDASVPLNGPEPKAWCDLLESYRPTIVDVHTLTPSLGLAHVIAARRRHARTIVTAHLPDLICARGTFMRFGTSPCDGDLRVQPCTACRLEARGVPPAVGRALGAVPETLSNRLAELMLPRGLKAALTASVPERNRRAILLELARHADRIVAPSAWLAESLVLNGIPASHVVLCRQGVTNVPARVPSQTSGALRVGFVGRYDPVKGLHVLVAAAKLIPEDVAIEFHVWGIARTPASRAYRDEIVRQAHGDRRMVFHDEIANPSDAYAAIDALAVPSIWLETGPLVVLEAQAAGLPVVGSNLGGIAERVIDQENGILVPPDDAAALAGAFVAIARDRVYLTRLRHHGAVRTTADVVRETLATYRSVAAEAAA